LSEGREREMTKWNHKDAYAGSVNWKSLAIDVYVCTNCERVRVSKKRVWPVGY